MSNQTVRNSRWIGRFTDHAWMYRAAERTVQVREKFSLAAGKIQRIWQRIKWRSPLMLGFALSLIYWVGLYGWMIADVDFKAFRYAGF